jgi:hypothetical protein
MFIITKEEEETIQLDEMVIQVLPIWKFLLYKQKYLEE